MSETDQPIEGNSDALPSNCRACGAFLCLRKQVINLALGNTESMLCLECLGKEGEQSAEQVLAGIKHYVLLRECLRKEWLKYVDVEYCPDPQHCFPATCFAQD